MIKKYALVLVVFLCFVMSGFGQVTVYNETMYNGTGGASGNTIATHETNNRFNEDGLTYSGTGDMRTTSASTAAYTGASGTWNTMLNANTETLVMDGLDLSSYSSTTLSVGIRKSTTTENGSGLIIEYSTTGSAGAFTSLSWGSLPVGTGTATWYLVSGVSIPNNITTLRFRITNTVEWRIDDIIISGTAATCTDELSFYNLQSPATGTITIGGAYDVYAQAWESGITPGAGAGAGVEAWIGFNTLNTDPSTWAETDWTIAPYNVAATGNNDEFVLDLGAEIPSPGTYYYASRFRFNSCGFTYGGFDTGGGDGSWDGTQDVNGVLTVDADQVNFCNVDFPKAATITAGGTHNVYAQAYEPGVTNAGGQGANLLAWIGYTTVGIDHQPWSVTGWTWVPATYDSDSGPGNNNDQYVADIGTGRTAGTYYYASRFQLNGSDYSYGGIQSDNVGNFWTTGTFNNGTLTVTPPPLADVVITEIMYNPSGTDDEWIEICNISGSPQNISGYTVRIGATTAFTFPASTIIANGNCITVSLGSNGDGIYNNACPFTPTFGIGASTSNTNNLVNSSNTISLYSSDGTTLADAVTYNSGNGGDGNDASLHVTNATLNNSNTNTNWQEVVDGGTPGTNILVSPCSKPELQLQNSSGTNQTCGAFTINFGNQATGFNTDITFDIDNIGNLPLNVTALGLSGTNPGDFSIVSPVIPFTVNAGGTQTVTVRFLPTAIGARTATLTINSNDADEAACIVNLQGTGTTPISEITVRGNINPPTYPNIVNGDTTPSFLDNTMFAAQFIGASQAKSYRIINDGTANLTVSSVTIGGVNPGDFTVTIPPAATITPGAFSLLEVTFSPLAAGVRTAIVSIANTDGNADENPFTFTVQGTGNCVSASTTISPSSGSVGTIITVIGTDFGGSTTAQISGTPATVVVISSTVIEVTVPIGATTGNLVINNNLGCTSTNSFNVINTQIGGCEGSSNLTDLIISEITDATVGGLSYIEIFNGTGSPVALGGYALSIYSNGTATPTYTLNLNSVTLNPNAVYVVAIGVASSPDYTDPGADTCSITGGNGELANQTSTLAGINKKTDEHDMIRLVKSSGTVVVDQFGVYQDIDWMDSTIITGDRGFNFRRLNTASPLPNPAFNINDWNVIDWVGSGLTTCLSNNYSDIGLYDFSTGTPPSVTLEPVAPVSSCDLTATLTVTGAEGFNGVGDTQEIAYQWFYNSPGTNTWVEILSSNTDYTGQQSTTLNILNTLNLDKYQYYCQVREDGATCFKASNAVRLTVQKKVWTGVWTPTGAPTISDIVVIDADYTTNATNGSFSACQLIVNATRTLTIANNYFVEVENNVKVDGNIIVNPKGSFVQNNNSGTVTGAVLSDKTKIAVEKLTAPAYAWYEYTYWSSPVVGETIIDGLADAASNRRFWFNAQNFLDDAAETNNNNTLNYSLTDDIDDNGDDWIAITNDLTVLEFGVGYATVTNQTIFNSTPINPNGSRTIKYTFRGPFNNGNRTIPVYKNDFEAADNNWNFIGNPYASAISANTFFAANNSTLDSAIYLWSQNTAPSNTTNGNEGLNFSQSDYAVINMASEIQGGDDTNNDGVVNALDRPKRFIPSGQGFFVSYSHTGIETAINGTIKTGQVVFNNNMRVKTADNDQFFRTSNAGIDNKLWVNLTSDNGVFNQISVAYVNGATNENDGMSYDAPRNLSTGAYSILYSIIENEDKKLAIQGKNPNSLTLDEVIRLGFSTSINVATIYKLTLADVQGDFLSENTIYLKDNLLDIHHNLSQSEYTFTSTVGEFNERFEIVFQPETLSIGEQELNANSLSIIELNDGRVKFTVGNHLTIQSVEIIDMLGRTLYRLEGSNSSETYNLSNLRQAAYIAKVKLSNGQTITKRAIKRL